MLILFSLVSPVISLKLLLKEPTRFNKLSNFAFKGRASFMFNEILSLFVVKIALERSSFISSINKPVFSNLFIAFLNPANLSK